MGMIFDVAKIFCPINVSDSHWALIVVDNEKRSIVFYDSLQDEGRAHRYLEHMLNFMTLEAKNRQRSAVDWSIQCCRAAPQQNNGYDCGVFTIMYADYISDGLKVQFEQKHMNLFRRKICAHILRGELTYPLPRSVD